MKRITVLVVVICILAASVLCAAAKRPKLWAGISVNQPVFTYQERGRVNLTFSVVNDGSERADPRVGDSKLIINGKAWPNSDISFSNGPRDAHFSNLLPGDLMLFTMAMTDDFSKPGTYRLYWQGPYYRSSEIVFRVLPEKK